MNSLKTVLFPATVIHSIRQYPLFLLTPQISIIRPVESKADQGAEDSPDSFIKSGLCQEDTPCPLGEDLDRFLHLVGDIEKRKDDYAAQLSSLTLAGMTSPATNGEQSESAIIGDLLTPKDLSQEKEQQAREEKLWQARLVLAIGEILEREEEDIAKNLSVLDDETSTLFNALKGEMDEFEEDNPFAELRQLKGNFNATHSTNMAKKLKSWATLFEKSILADSRLFITTSMDVIDILSESYDGLNHEGPVEFSGIEIPGLIGWNEQEALAAVNKFSANNPTLQGELLSTIKNLVQNVEVEEASWQKLTSVWNEKLETEFPAEELGRSPVTAYLFNECSLLTLLGLQDKTTSTDSLVVLHIGY